MKTFNQFKSLLSESTKGIKISGIPVEIKKVGKKFTAIIDGDVLDSYSSEEEAAKMAKEFIKQYKGK
jgi:hypothetical protein